MSRHFAGGLCLGNRIQEISPLCISEQLLGVAGQPIFNAILGLLGVALEGAG